jgi:hypothetical protein
MLVLTLTLICSYAYFAPGKSLRSVSAQSKPLSGSFGFLINASVANTSNDGGSAILGIINFETAQATAPGPITFRLALRPIRLAKA